MGKNRNLLLNFLFLLIISSFLVSANTWTQYGSDYNPITNSLSTDYNGNFIYGLVNVSSSSLALGLPTTGGYYQPLTFQPNPLSTELNAILGYSSYIDVYNKAFVLLDRKFINTGINLVSQPAIGYLTDDANKTQYFGVYTQNAQSIFYVHDIDQNSQITFNQSLNISYNASIIAGVKKDGKNVYFAEITNFNASTYNLNLSIVNITNGLLTYNTKFVTLISSGSSAVEPLSKVSNGLNDGRDLYLYWNSDRLYVFDQNGNIIFDYNPSALYVIEGAKLYKPSTSPYYAIHILEYSNAVNPNRAFLKAIRLEDLVTKFNVTVQSGTAVWLTHSGSTTTVLDWNNVGVNKEDILVYYHSTDGSSVARINLNAYNGDTGATLKSNSEISGSAVSNGLTYLTSADMDGDGYEDLIVSTVKSQRAMRVYSLLDSIDLFNVSSGSFFLSTENAVCIPTDITNDGNLDTFCSASTGTFYYSLDTINQPPTINSLTVDPSSTIQAGATISLTISASDLENDILTYAIQCDYNGTWEQIALALTKTCTYPTIGVYNLTIGVTDNYHYPIFNTFSNLITVTQTGAPQCNNNNLCETTETYASCPNDCANKQNTTFVNPTGGLNLPVDIVSSDGQNGWLPEIYTGILTLLSYILYPMLLIFSVVIILFILIAMLSFPKKLFEMIG